MARINQGLTYLFGKYNTVNNQKIKEILTKEEFEIFNKMSNYDKIHSYNLFDKVSQNKILKDNKLFLKLALLHDCGKENLGLFCRIKEVLVGDEKVKKHVDIGYEKLEKINRPLAYLIKIHHDTDKINNFENLEMKIFKSLDDE